MSERGPERPACVRVLGVDFFAGPLEAACARAAAGGLVTAPSGPGIAHDLAHEPAYRRALESSELVLTDSGFLVLLWRLRTGEKLPRHSGLKFLRAWLARDDMKIPGAVLWVMPTAAEAKHTRAWLARHGFPANTEDFYVAPHYGRGPISDEALLTCARTRRPRVIYLGLGGGVQERLGHGLRDRLDYRPTIMCLGAALAFVTGAQGPIPPWVDRWMLGWLWRIGADPARFAPRYLRALRLAWIVLRFGAEAPR
jgi:UDP-N-acetyl-D-mannosaminuronic acid transferase (WecB/TagA/CpsF family)